MHKFATGLNFTYDKYSEFVNLSDVSRIDNSVGAFFEYTFDNNNKFSYILGGRFDYHNRLGAFFTPRLHVRYNPWEKSVLRFSAGRGKRAANIYAENQQLFASSRLFSILDTDGKIYGLDPEIAWNYGVSFTQNFILFGKSADMTLDFYRTDFQNQVIVDVMQSSQEVLFYNLRGNSYANSLQIDFNYEIIKHFNLRTAYKYYDISTDYLSGSFQRPLQAKHRFFSNLEYETHISNEGQQWRFDATFNWLGKQQLPTTSSNPVGDVFPEFSPSFSTLNLQITVQQSKNFELYFGGENIGNYRQTNAILGKNNPFGMYFDTSVVYAPIFGQMFYAGLRFKIK
jgi:outer membrane receptor for ferrienterochelin and colicin